MNITNLLNSLHIGVSNTSDPVELLMLSKAVQQLNMGKVSTVATLTALPSASSNEGQLYLVASDSELYYSNGTLWVPINTEAGTSWTWGSGGSGILGDNTTTCKSSPVSVIGGFTDWCQINAGTDHMAAIRLNGTLWAWGLNSSGRLGDNSVIERSSPVSVVGGFTDWCQVSAGSAHTAAIRTNGTLWAWGNNNTGRLGDGTTTSRSSPVSVVGGFTDWCQVCAGNAHTIAIRRNGTLWAWGSNANGRLGDGTINSQSSPVSVIGGFTDWCQVSAGSASTAAIRVGGTLWTWGSNSAGALGQGTITDQSSPASIIGGFTDWCQVSVGGGHMAAIRANGTLWAWGCNVVGQFGNGSTVDRSSPVSVVGGFTDWCHVNAGYCHTAAVRQNGTLWAWGCNGSGRLGDGTTVNKSSPASIVGGFTNWRWVSAGLYTTAAVRDQCN